jgi:ABC-type iron transport system FetAB ATPase subunit
MVEKSLIMNPLLSAKSLHILRGQGTTASLILNGSASFDLCAGDCVHLNGLSGIGKTTVLWTLACLYPLHSGQLYCGGQTVQQLGFAAWRANIALLPQKPVIFAGSVRDNLLYPLENIAIQKTRFRTLLPLSEEVLQAELQQVGLGEIPLEREASQLSGGQQARLTLVRTLLTRPQVLLADEPTASLDETTGSLVWQRLGQFCQQGGAILFTSHAVATTILTKTLYLHDATLSEN